MTDGCHACSEAGTRIEGTPILLHGAGIVHWTSLSSLFTRRVLVGIWAQVQGKRKQMQTRRNAVT